MQKVYSDNQHDFYIGRCANTLLYNIVPVNLTPPTGGYPNRRYIERIKNTKFPDRYQPTLHGTRECYTSDEWSGIEL